jgi:hypothetical protein
MKRSLLLMAAIALAGSSFSQTSISLKDSTYSYYNWNVADNDWDDVVRNQYSYNFLHEEIRNFTSQSAGTGWQNFQNTKNYVYNANHNLLEVTYEQWTSGSWADDSKDICTYNTSGDMLSKLQQTMFGGLWRNTYNTLYTYSGGNKISGLYQFWSTTTASWTNMYRTTYMYNTGNQLTEAVNEDWISGAWTPSTKLTNHIYSGLDLVSYDSYSWDATASIYRLFEKVTFTYNATHDVTNITIQQWDAATLSWENYMKIDYTYDSYRNKLTEITETWDVASAAWKHDKMVLHYYTTGTVGVNELSAQENLSFHPNPAINELTVSATTDQRAEILSTDGKVIISVPVTTGSNTIDFRELPKGMYFIRLDGKTGKVIKE